MFFARSFRFENLGWVELAFKAVPRGRGGPGRMPRRSGGRGVGRMPGENGLPVGRGVGRMPGENGLSSSAISIVNKLPSRGFERRAYQQRP